MRLKIGCILLKSAPCIVDMYFVCESSAVADPRRRSPGVKKYFSSDYKTFRLYTNYILIIVFYHY